MGKYVVGKFEETHALMEGNNKSPEGGEGGSVVGNSLFGRKYRIQPNRKLHQVTFDKDHDQHSGRKKASHGYRPQPQEKMG